MPYGNGDITHSSGHLMIISPKWDVATDYLWSPRTTLDESFPSEMIVRLWFGHAAAPFHAKQLLQFGKNLGEKLSACNPWPKKQGIDSSYRACSNKAESDAPWNYENQLPMANVYEKGALDKVRETNVMSTKRNWSAKSKIWCCTSM